MWKICIIKGQERKRTIKHQRKQIHFTISCKNSDLYMMEMQSVRTMSWFERPVNHPKEQIRWHDICSKSKLNTPSKTEIRDYFKTVYEKLLEAYSVWF